MEDILYRFLSIFHELPIFVKQVLGFVYRALPTSIKYGPFYRAYLSRIKEFNSYKTQEDVNNSHDRLMVEHVNRAINTIPAYKDYPLLNEPQDIVNLPILCKDDIVSDPQRYIKPDSRKESIPANTGGSSGNPMQFFIQKGVSRPKEKAHFNWFWGQFGYREGARMLMVRGKPLKDNRLFEYESIGNILNVSCYGVNKDNIAEVYGKIISFKPKFIHAYPSSLKILTSLLEDANLECKLDIQAIFLGSEHLMKHDREYLETYYRSRVVSWYGHSERLVHGGNCPQSNLFHFYPFYGHMELIDEDGKPVKIPGKQARLIATGFDNEVMPFIRYDTGDLAVLSGSTECSCGYKGTSIEQIAGRGQDIIILDDGTRVTLTAFIFGQHLSAFNEIREMQIIQEVQGEIRMLIVCNSNFTKREEKELVDVLEESVKGRIKITITYVSNIPKTSRGKSRFFISRL